MGDIPPASFDPLFFLHHAYVDFLLWCWQVNFRSAGQQLFSVVPSYSPFRMSATAPWFRSQEITNPGSLDYAYVPSSVSGIWHNGGRRRVLGEAGRQLQQMEVVGMEAGGLVVTPASATTADPSSATAEETLRRYVRYLQRGYDGYMFQARIFEVDCKAVGQPWMIMAFLKSSSSSGGTSYKPVTMGSDEGWRSLSRLPNFCSAWSGIACWMAMSPAAKVSVTLDLTKCLRSSSNFNPDQPPLNPADPSLGPAKAPVTLDDLEFRAYLRGTSEDITDKVNLVKLPSALTWSWMFDHGSNLSQGSNPGDSAVAAAAAAEGLGEVPVPQELYTAHVVAGEAGVPKVIKSEAKPAVFGNAGGVFEYEAAGRRVRLL